MDVAHTTLAAARGQAVKEVYGVERCSSSIEVRITEWSVIYASEKGGKKRGETAETT